MTELRKSNKHFFLCTEKWLSEIDPILSKCFYPTPQGIITRIKILWQWCEKKSQKIQLINVSRVSFTSLFKRKENKKNTWTIALRRSKIGITLQLPERKTEAHRNAAEGNRQGLFTYLETKNYRNYKRKSVYHLIT